MEYNTNSLEENWMPFTGNRDFKKSPRLVVRGEGIHSVSYTHLTLPTKA